MMKYEDIPALVAELEASVSTDEELLSTIEELGQEIQMQLVHFSATEKFFDETKKYSVGTIDFLDSNQLVNNYSTGASRREPMLGVLNAIASLYQQSTDNQGRQELQCQDQNSQHAVELTTRASDLAIELVRITREILLTEMEYHAVLEGRKYNVEFQDNQGEFQRHSAEQVAAKEAEQRQRQEYYAKQLEANRKIHEDNYWGRGTLPEIEQHGTAQTILPLWTVGFTPEQN